MGASPSSQPTRLTRMTPCESKTRSARCPASSCPTTERFTTAIIEFLQDVAGTDRLLPLRGRERYRALTLSRLADGIMDASVLVVYESRFRPDLPHSPRWLAHQRGKILRGLTEFENSPPDPNKTDVVSIGLSCALGYLDWRKQVDWRSAYPRLVSWLERFSAHEPAFERTRAKDT
jgi:glutathione S-transferase